MGSRDFFVTSPSSDGRLCWVLKKIQVAPTRMNCRLSKEIYRQIEIFLSRHHKSLVTVRPSSVVGAGNGVFAVEDIPPDQIVCLYPGIFTPGLPNGLFHDNNDSTMIYYLAKEVTPSGLRPEHNPYILNLQATGGYLDAKALTLVTTDDDDNLCKSRRHRCLDENPTACGHLINHSSRQANVEVASFRWRDVAVVGANTTTWKESKDQYGLPNALRADGSLWYMEGSTVVRFPSVGAHNDSVVRSLCGAAMFTSVPIEKDSELFLNYNLKGPNYPAWATAWYSSCA